MQGLMYLVARQMIQIEAKDEIAVDSEEGHGNAGQYVEELVTPELVHGSEEEECKGEWWKEDDENGKSADENGDAEWIRWAIFCTQKSVQS